MAIFIDAEAQAQLTSFDGLVAAICAWLQRDDLADRAPDFVRLAEGRVRRLIVAPDQEKVVTITPGATTPLPADFDSARLLYLPGSPRRIISPMSPAEIYERPFDIAGQPNAYAIAGGGFVFSPTPDQAYGATLIYRATIPALGPQQQTNWLLTKHPDVYLYASLVQAEFFGWNDERLGLIKSALDEAVQEVNDAGNRQRYSGALLAAKPAVSEGVRGAYRR